MIFVTVGGMRAFDRLIIEMDRIAGELDEPIVMQIGSTDYEPANCDCFRFLPRSDMNRLCADARVVVSHAGAGSVLTALQHNKPLVLVPRLKKYGEVFDDHQVEIARQVEAQGAAVVCDVANLATTIANAGVSPAALTGRGELASRLREYLDRLEGHGKA